MYYFTADWHLGHKNIIKYCNRPFKHPNEMDEIILYNARNILGSKDTLCYLGDLTFEPRYFNIFDNFPCEIIYILGNHDKKSMIPYLKKRCRFVGDLYNLKIEDQSMVLSHYAMRVWHKSHYNSWNLHGHSHGILPSVGKSKDVGVDGNNFKLYNFPEIKYFMDKQPDNINFGEKSGGRETI